MPEMLKSRKFWVTVAGIVGIPAEVAAGMDLKMLILQVALMAIWLIAQGMADWGKERAKIEPPTATLEVTIPPPSNKVPAPPRVPGMLGMLLCCVVALAVPVSGCGLLGGKGADTSQLVERSAALAFNGAVVALEVVDAKNAAYLRSIEKPTEADVEASAVRLERLKRARDALSIVRGYLAGERKGDGRRELGDAVDALALVAEELKSHGVDIPKRVTDGLQVAAAFAKVS